jgi:putative inorganic carbon (HCO3(-)) transporter
MPSGQSNVFAAVKSIGGTRWAWADLGLQVVLWINVITLPVAGTSAVREWCLGLGLALWLLRSTGSGRWRFNPTRLWPFLLLFTGCILISIPLAVDWRYSLSEFRGEWLKGLAWFYLTVQAVDEEWKVYGLMGAVLAGTVLMIGFGVIHGIWSPHWNWGLISEQSLAAGVGTYSTYLVLTFSFLWLPFTATKRKGWWLAAVLLLAGSSFMILMSTQRAAWLTLVLLIPLGILIVSRRWGWTGLTAALVVAVFVVWLQVLPRNRWIRGDEGFHPIRGLAAVTEMVDRPLTVFGRRGQIWRSAVLLALRHPFTGVGYGRGSLMRADVDFNLLPLYWHAHNTFLNVAAGTGLTGLVAFCALMLALWWRAWRLWRADAGLMSLIGGMVWLMVTGFLFRNLFNDFFIDDTGLLFWILAALLYVPVWQEVGRPKADPPPGPG